MLNAAIAREKAARTRYIVKLRDGDVYTLKPESCAGRLLRLVLRFYKLDRLPEMQDALYFSGHLASGLEDNLYCYQFSAEFGWPSARKPHDFLQNAEEFLILEYADGATVLLEDQYG